ncbi:MAG: hypothetical protein Q8S00_20440 [Deltaproteobacteria bacterium]|nr:hypothetical protein [Deltaproteobacteria bacterium]MDZ4345444.1 hypothetical protein [Candidatus Binatia bacterium]
MKTHKPSSPRFAICVDNSEYRAPLEMHKIYRVLPDADAALDGDLRFMDESGEDYLYPMDYFVVIAVPRRAAQDLAKSFTCSERHAA